jgi:hypothetical protein
MKVTKKPAAPTAPRLQKAFMAASTKGDLAAQVRIARVSAREMIWLRGVDDENLHVMEELAGPFPDPGPPPGDARSRAVPWELYCHHINAAFALGIAVGQLVHPDVFTPGAAK